MAKVISFLLALCMLPVLYGCQYDMDVLEKGSYSREAAEYLSGELEPEYSMNDGTTIEPDTLVDTDGVLVKLLGVVNTPLAPELELVFDKGNNERLHFEVDYVNVDGWQCSGTIFPIGEAMSLSFSNFSAEYSKFPAEINIGTDPLTECGLLDEIHEIELSYRLSGTSRTGVIAEGVYTMKTSNEGEPAPFSCDGPVLLDEDGIRVQIYSFDYGTYLGDDCMDLILYVENDSDRRIELVIGDAEKYEKDTEEEANAEQEESESTAKVIARNVRDGKQRTSVPLSGSENICAGARSLGHLQTANAAGRVTISEEEELAFSLKIYDYEEYDPDELPDPLYEKTVTLTTEDVFSPG